MATPPPKTRTSRIGQDKLIFRHKLQQEKSKIAAGLLADADITNKLDPTMVRALLEE